MHFVQDPCVAEYLQGARNHLSFRCPGCDDTGNLFVEALSGTELDAAKQTLLMRIRRAQGDKRQVSIAEHELKRLWLLFTGESLAPSHERQREWRQVSAGEAVQASEVWSALFSALRLRVESFWRLRDVLSLVSDPERRCALHVACLMQHPWIYTPCCGAPYCWRCQVEGHHDGSSCQENQLGEGEIEFQTCPECGVPTQKTEGCCSIRCLCGAQWRWHDHD